MHTTESPARRVITALAAIALTATSLIVAVDPAGAGGRSTDLRAVDSRHVERDLTARDHTRPVRKVTDTMSGGAQCPGSGAVPAGATQHSIASGDVDGDGDADTLHGYVVDGQGYVQVSFTGGGGSTLAVDPGPSMPVAPRPNPGHDVDADGRDEFTARIAGGVGGLGFGLYEVDGCDLVAYTLDGSPAVLHHRETIGNMSGFFCISVSPEVGIYVYDLDLVADPSYDELLVPEVDPTLYVGSLTNYHLIDGELVEISVVETAHQLGYPSWITSVPGCDWELGF